MKYGVGDTPADNSRYGKKYQYPQFSTNAHTFQDVSVPDRRLPQLVWCDSAGVPLVSGHSFPSLLIQMDSFIFLVLMSVSLSRMLVFSHSMTWLSFNAWSVIADLLYSFSLFLFLYLSRYCGKCEIWPLTSEKRNTFTQINVITPNPAYGVEQIPIRNRHPAHIGS